MKALLEQLELVCARRRREEISDAEATRLLVAAHESYRLGRDGTARRFADPFDLPDVELLQERTYASPASSADVDSFARWESMVSDIHERDAFAAAVLREVGLVRLGGGVLRLAVHSRSVLATESLRGVLEQAARSLALTLEVEDASPKLPERPSITLVAESRRERATEQLDSEARRHPTIRALLREFDGRIKATRPLSSEVAR